MNDTDRQTQTCNLEQDQLWSYHIGKPLLQHDDYYIDYAIPVIHPYVKHITEVILSTV